MYMDKENLKRLYLEKNMTQEEIAKMLNSSVNHVGYLIRKYSLRKSNSQKAFSSVKKRNYVEIKNKREKTNLKKYGIRNVFCSNEWQESIHKAQKRKNNGKLAFNTQKQKETLLKKYGVDNISKLYSTQKKREETNLKKYGVSSVILTESSQKKAFLNNGRTISKKNREWQRYLKEKIGIEFQLEKDHFDLVYKNVAVDINPTVTHNSSISYAYLTGRTKENKPLPKDYHYKRYLRAKEKGYILISVFDWYDPEKIVDIIKSKLQLCERVFNARECTIKKVSRPVTRQFLEENHIQGYTPATYSYGLFYKDELTQLITLGKPRLRKDADFELIRLCSKKDCIIRGGKTKLITSFKKDFPGKKILSYTNLNISQADGIYIYPAGSWVKGKERISEITVLKKGASRIVGDNNFRKYKKGESNEEIMLKEGWVKVYDCGSVLNYL